MSRPDTDSPLNNTKISTICQLLRYDPYCYAIKNKNEIATLTLARTNEGVIARNEVTKQSHISRPLQRGGLWKAALF